MTELEVRLIVFETVIECLLATLAQEDGVERLREFAADLLVALKGRSLIGDAEEATETGAASESDRRLRDLLARAKSGPLNAELPVGSPGHGEVILPD